MEKKIYMAPEAQAYQVDNDKSLCLGSVGGETDDAAKRYYRGRLMHEDNFDDDDEE